MGRLTSSAAAVGAATLASRVLGFIRDLMIARIFGADAATDAFFVAFKIPNLARRLFAEGSFAMALVPALNAQRQGGKESIRSMISELGGTLILAGLVIIGLGLLGAPALVLTFAPGFGADAERFHLAVELLRLTLPYLGLVGLAALAASILNTYERFAIPALTPALLNLAMIGCALWLAPHLDPQILALAWGVLIGGLLQLAIQLPPLARLGLLTRPSFSLRSRGSAEVFKRMGPSILGSSVGQISLLLDTVLASLLATGSISWLYYADRLMELPLGLLGAALGTVILPRLSQAHAERTPERFAATLDWALRLGLLFGLPAALGLSALAGPILAALFQSQSFSAEDARMAAWGLTAYALGIPPFILIRILVPACYAQHDLKTPLKAASIALGIGLILHLVLMAWMGHTGLALATALTAWLNAALLLGHLLNEGVYRPSPESLSLLTRLFVSGLAMTLVLWLGTGPIDGWLEAPALDRLLGLGGWIIGGAAIYGGALALLGVRPRAFLA